MFGLDRESSTWLTVYFPVSWLTQASITPVSDPDPIWILVRVAVPVWIQVRVANPDPV